MGLCVCVCVCVCVVCVYVYICMHMHVPIPTHIYTEFTEILWMDFEPFAQGIHTHTHAHIRICMNICTYILLHMNICMHMYIHNICIQMYILIEFTEILQMTGEPFDKGTYRVAKTHRIPYLYRSFSAKEPYI